MPALFEFTRRPMARLLSAGQQPRQASIAGAVSALRGWLPDVSAAGRMVEKPIDLGLVEYWLDEWRYSMQAHRPVDDMVVNDRPWQDASRAVNEDYEGAVEDQRMAGIVDALDACIDSLEVHHRAAIWRAYEQIAAFMFKRLNFEATLAEAKQELGVMMRRKGYPC